MRPSILVGSLGMLMVLRAGAALAQAAPLKPGTRTISVSGHGEIKTKPDLMVVSFAVNNTAPSAEQCTKLQMEKTQRLVDTLKAKLGANAKVETSDYTLNPSYEPDNTQPGQTEESPAEWTYKATITAGTDDIAALGSLVDAGLAAGASDVAGSGFQFFPADNRASSAPKPNARFDNHVSSMVTGFPSESAMKQRPSVSLEVETHGATADQAVSRGTQISDKVERALKAKLGDHGVLMVQSFGILKSAPSQVQPANTFRPVPERRIYSAHTTVTAKTNKLDSLGALIEAGIKAGATQLNLVRFTLEDPAASNNAAIAAAVKDAASRAKMIATSMGVTLGKPLSISSNAQVQQQTIYGNVFGAAMSGLPTASVQHAIMPVLPHDLDVGANVNVVYEIE